MSNTEHSFEHQKPKGHTCSGHNIGEATWCICGYCDTCYGMDFGLPSIISRKFEDYRLENEELKNIDRII